MKDFETFWNLYPRKVGKIAAQKSFTRAVKQGVEPEIMIEGVRHYKFSDDKQFVPHPATWLNQGRYMDEESKPANGTPIEKSGFVVVHNTHPRWRELRRMKSEELGRPYNARVMEVPKEWLQGIMEM